MQLEPLFFDPVIVAKPWGGRRLERYGKTLPDGSTYGESWEIADLPEEAVSSADRSRTVVARGRHAGRTLRGLISEFGDALMGSVRPTEAGDFPLLFKLLDAREHLSVQVHPTEKYVANHPGTWLKTESWYVVDAEPGSVIYKGLRPGVGIDDVRRAAGTEAFVELMQPHPATAGDFHHLPAGIIHALGAGVLVAEPQTPSDTTFRLYDWTVEYGRAPRTLHLEEAIEAIVIEPEDDFALAPATDGSRTLITTEHYWMREHRVTDSPVPLAVADELTMVCVVRGAATLEGRDGRHELEAGATCLVPAAATAALWARGDAVVLEIGLAATAISG